MISGNEFIPMLKDSLGFHSLKLYRTINDEGDFQHYFNEERLSRYIQGTKMDLFIKNYDVSGQDILIFEQHFPDGVANASVAKNWNPEIANNAATVVQTGFPVIQVPKEDTGLGFITPGGNMMGNTKLSVGPFYNLSMEDGEAPLPKGTEGGFFIDRRQDPGSK